VPRAGTPATAVAFAAAWIRHLAIVAHPIGPAVSLKIEGTGKSYRDEISVRVPSNREGGRVLCAQEAILRHERSFWQNWCGRPWMPEPGGNLTARA
jgi:hypothetical protein